MKVKVISMVPYSVGLNIPDYRISKKFTQEGQVALIEEEALAEAMYHPGTGKLFSEGILKIEGSNDFKLGAGLAEVNEKEEIVDTVVTLNTSQMLVLLKTKPIEEFKETVKKLSQEQLNLLAGLAVSNKVTDYEKCKVLRELTGKDIMKTITLTEDEE
jgi:hypothetical protein